MTLKRASFFIDGFNLYHSIASSRKLKKYKWLNLRSLCEKFITKSEQIHEVYYFTAYAEWRPESSSRHRAYVAANQYFGCTPIFGKFIEKERISRVHCNQPCETENNKSKCGKIFLTHEEKLTDVNIAINLLKKCILNECDSVYLLSGDNDLIPALMAVHELCPAIETRVIIPIHARARNLIRVCSENNFKYIRINENHLAASQLPDSIQSGNRSYTCPPQWKL